MLKIVKTKVKTYDVMPSLSRPLLWKVRPSNLRSLFGFMLYFFFTVLGSKFSVELSFDNAAGIVFFHFINIKFTLKFTQYKIHFEIHLNPEISHLYLLTENLFQFTYHGAHLFTIKVSRMKKICKKTRENQKISKNQELVVYTCAPSNLMPASDIFLQRLDYKLSS